MRFLIFIAGILVGFTCIKCNKWLVDNVDIRFGALERFIGPGSMYGIWKIIGVILIIVSIYVLFGGFGL